MSAYEPLWARVEKPGRYLGNERGMIRKDPTTVEVRFALAFPEVYEIAQSHPGLQLLYDILNRRADVYAERVYAPWFDMERELRTAGLPLASLETLTPLHAFDVVGFTLQYELTYTNILAMLDLGGVPLHARDRAAEHPLVIGGGPCAFNPEPLADFFDAILLGDGEAAVGDICDVYAAWDRHDRRALLEALTRVPGMYVPAFFIPEYRSDGRLSRVRPLKSGYERVEKRILPDLDAAPLQDTFVVPTVQIVHDRPSLEVMRGCVKGCRFCQAGYIYRPLRERDPRRVLEQAERAVTATGHDEVSLLSLSTGDYSCVNPLLTELMNRLEARKVAVSIPSTRVDALAPTLLEQIKRVRKTGFTLAPEAGSQRLRDIIQKEYREEELLEAAGQIFALGWRSLKLYFMLGLPGETEDDLRGIAELAAKVAALGGPRVQVTASVSNFVPKAHTPFQWTAQLPPEEMESRQRFLGRELRRRRVTFRWHEPTLSFLEGIFSRGDRRTGALLRRAYQLGCRFDGWTDACRVDLWTQALSECGLSADFYLRRRLLDEPLPWDHLGSGVTKAFLQRELARAFERTLTPDCSVERCTFCGACDFATIRNVDYHLSGARGADHRGAAIDHWARDVVGTDSLDGAWEPRGWQRVHGTPPSPAVAAAPGTTDEAPLRPASAPPHDARGLGNAEEWLAAGGESLAPRRDTETTTVRARLRLRYRKVGLARFIGGRELATLFYRAGRRAALPIAFSAGHHPLPRLSFGPALPVGVESEDELVDVDLTRVVDPGEARRALSGQLPVGLEIISAHPVAVKGPSIASLIVACQYRVDLAPLLNGAGLSPIRARLAAFRAAAQFPVRKQGKGQIRQVDARAFVEAIGLEVPATLTMTIACGTTGTLKPSDLLGSLLGIDDRAARSLRVRKVAGVFASAAAETPVAAAPQGA